MVIIPMTMDINIRKKKIGLPEKKSSCWIWIHSNPSSSIYITVSWNIQRRPTEKVKYVKDGGRKILSVLNTETNIMCVKGKSWQLPDCIFCARS